MTRAQIACLALLLLVGLFDLNWEAGRRPLWFDEVATYELAKLPSWGERVEALRNAADAMPPLYYELSAAALELPFTGEVNLRFWSIVGYLLAFVGVFAFVRQLADAWAGIGAAALLLVTEARSYGVEARPYSIWLGLGAVILALWLWNLRGGGVWRAVPLWIGLVLAASVHHFSLLMLPPLFAATALHDVLRRKPSWPVWVAFAAVLPVIAWHVPFLRTFQAFYGPTFWTRLIPVTIADLYFHFFSRRSIWFGIALVASIPLLGRLVRKRVWSKPSPVQWAVALLLASLVVLPFWMAFAANLLHFTLTPRYAFPTVLGVVAAIGWLAGSYEAWTGWRRFAFVVAAALLAGYSLTKPLDGGDPIQSHRPASFPFPVEIQRESGLPVAVASGLDFLPWLYYSPELRPRLSFPFDQSAALKYLAHDTIERIFLRLPPASGLRQTPNYDAFVYQHKRFYVAARRGEGFWLPAGLKDLGAKFELVAERRAWQLFVVTLPDPPKLERP